MTLRRFLVPCCGILFFALPSALHAQRPVAPGVPPAQERVATLGDALKRHETTASPLHMLYVHGIADERAGDSELLRRYVCKHQKGCDDPSGSGVFGGREYADTGSFAPSAAPPPFEYMGRKIWETPQQWTASSPFVDHWKLTFRKNHQVVLLDEINWWPLAFALKCQNIVATDAALTGVSGNYVHLCFSPYDGDPHATDTTRSFPWISKDQLDTLSRTPQRAAKINRSLKAGVMDWGFSDALMAVGPMQILFREGLRDLLFKSIQYSGEPGVKQRVELGDHPEREFVVISHSLGSYLMFSTLRTTAWTVEERGKTQGPGPEVSSDTAFTYLLQHTGMAYFFANQIPLLELATLGKGGALTPVATTQVSTIAKTLQTWGALRQGSGFPRPQLVAWNDPSDLLTWQVPDLGEDVTVHNLKVRNSFHWFGLLEGPRAAHDGYAKNKDVLHALLDGRGEPIPPPPGR